MSFWTGYVVPATRLKQWYVIVITSLVMGILRLERRHTIRAVSKHHAERKVFWPHLIRRAYGISTLSKAIRLFLWDLNLAGADIVGYGLW